MSVRLFHSHHDLLILKFLRDIGRIDLIVGHVKCFIRIAVKHNLPNPCSTCFSGDCLEAG